MTRFEGKSALVTGGSRGIGRAIASRLAQDGAHVTIVGRTAATLESAVADLRQAGGSVDGVVADVSVEDDIERIVNEVVASQGTLDILVNNAALDNDATFLDLTRAQWDQALHMNLGSVFLMSQAAARQMVQRGGGVIINIGSINGHGSDGSPIYSAAKSAVHSLTRDIAVELADRGVRCVTVSPGWVDTEMIHEYTTPELLHTLRNDFRRVPLGRLLRTEEVANVVAFAASDEASGVTGCELLVDGGVLASLNVYGEIFS